MSKCRWLARLATGVLFLSVFAGGALAGEIQAGLAIVDITPPAGGKTVGYSSAQPTDGIHDPVTARILVLKQAEPSLCLAVVVCDLCVYNSPWLHEQMPSIGVDQLLLMNTHTHAGPDLRQAEFPSPAEPWNRTVEQRVLAGIQQAQQALFPAYFQAANGHLQLGYNRLVREGNYSRTHFENPDRIPYGPVDPTVGVIRITDDKQQVRAVLVHYACHPVVLGPRNRKISADYPGVMRDLVEQRIGSQARCLFVQGAGGDINPLFMARGNDREGDFEVVQRMGQLLADKVLEILDTAQDKSGKCESLASASSQLTVAHRFAADQSLTLGVSTVLINGEIALVTMPGEPFHKFQIDWRRQSGRPHAYLLGYCCNGPYDWPSYIPDLLSAARGGYGASDTTRAEVGAGEQLLNRGLVQLFQLEGRLKSQPQRHTIEK